MWQRPFIQEKDKWLTCPFLLASADLSGRTDLEGGVAFRVRLLLLLGEWFLARSLPLQFLAAWSSESNSELDSVSDSELELFSGLSDCAKRELFSEGSVGKSLSASSSSGLLCLLRCDLANVTCRFGDFGD